MTTVPLSPAPPPPARAGRRSLIGLLASNAISLTGTQVSLIALPWYVLSLTGSATMTGLVAFCALTPYLLLRGLGGPLIDRIGGRKVGVLSDVASAGLCGLVPLLHVIGTLPLWLLFVLTALTGAARGPGDAAKGALVPQVARESGVSLERLSGLNGTVTRLAGSIGPAIAGAVVALSGPLPAMAVDAVSFLLSAAVMTATIRSAPGEKAADHDASYLSRLGAGVRFLRGDVVLLTLTLMVTVTNLLDNGVMSVVIPVWARGNGGPAMIGALTTAVSITAMLGSIVASVVGARVPRRPTYFICFLLGGAPRIALLALPASPWVVVAVWAASGFFLGFVSPILSATIYERIPEPMMGRVSSLTGTLSVAGTPLGGPIAGGLISLVGLSAAAWTHAVAYLAATTLPALGPSWGRASDQPDGSRPAQRERQQVTA